MAQRPTSKKNLRVVLSGISVVIPTFNEEDNVGALVERLHHALHDKAYELIFIDDHSTDNTVAKLTKLKKKFPITIRLKEGKSGKAFSLIEGFRIARHSYVCIIDSDLQYPPEAIPAMTKMMDEGRADVVVADRRAVNISSLRMFLSKGFRVLFGRFLWRLDVDVQSGLKVFRRELLDCLTLQPTAAWTFDLEFLVGARSGGYRLAGYEIDYVDRTAGESKIRWLSATTQIGVSSIIMRFNPPYFVPFHEARRRQYGQGFYYRSQKYITHTSLHLKEMAVQRTTLPQRLIGIMLAVLLVLAFLDNWHLTLVLLVALATSFYFLDLLFNLYLTVGSYYRDKEIKITGQDIRAVKSWPRYTIFCPLYREAAVVPQFVRAMRNLEYPHKKLEVLLLLEQDDHETISKIENMSLPDYFKVVVVPDGLPKTKPKACNYGLLKAKGTYAVIYDAEDIPDSRQLKKAVLAFRRFGPEIGCVQAKLNYYNTNQNLLTHLFTLEYSLWFSLVLTGLHSINAPIPLGGTSNHFRVRDLKSLGGWDPFNVTEDADLGIRLAKRGLRTAILDSYTLEEANSEFKNWLKQRSRWIKGYMQTYLVHMRYPRQLMATNNTHLPIMQLVIGGKLVSLLVNPLLWLLTLVYVFIPATNAFIQSLYPSPVLYMGVLCLAFGNFLYMYYYMLGVTKQDRPELAVYALLVPVYWIMMSMAAFYALRDLVVRPHHWHKTKHGLHLQKSDISQQDLLPETP